MFRVLFLALLDRSIAAGWLIMVILLLRALRLRRRLRASLFRGENVYVCDDISSPFVLGVIKPRVYLPSVMGQAQTYSVLLHEHAHIARFDSLWKVLGFLTNPAERVTDDYLSSTWNETVFVSSMCSCANRCIEIGEYFYAKDSDIFVECEFCNNASNSYERPHIHESGVVKQVDYCEVCGELIYQDSLYEDYQCLSSDGEFVKTE